MYIIYLCSSVDIEYICEVNSRSYIAGLFRISYMDTFHVEKIKLPSQAMFGNNLNMHMSAIIA